MVLYQLTRLILYQVHGTGRYYFSTNFASAVPDGRCLVCSVFVVSCRPLLTLPLELTGPDYDAFIGEFIEAAVDKYGKSVMLQVRDLGHTRVMPGMLQGARKDTYVCWHATCQSLFFPGESFCHRQTCFAILSRSHRTAM